jgi:hypothetical protein
MTGKLAVGRKWRVNRRDPRRLSTVVTVRPYVHPSGANFEGRQLEKKTIERSSSFGSIFGLSGIPLIIHTG